MKQYYVTDSFEEHYTKKIHNLFLPKNPIVPQSSEQVIKEVDCAITGIEYLNKQICVPLKS